MFKFPFGTQELQGVAARGNFDLTAHAVASGKSMEYYDDMTIEQLFEALKAVFETLTVGSWNFDTFRETGMFTVLLMSF